LHNKTGIDNFAISIIKTSKTMQTLIPFAPTTTPKRTFSYLVSKDILKMSSLQEKLDKIYIEKEILLEENTTFNTKYRYFLCGEAEEKYDVLEVEHEKLYKESVSFGEIVLKGLQDEELGIFIDTYFMSETPTIPKTNSGKPNPKEIVKAIQNYFGTLSIFNFRYIVNTDTRFLLEITVKRETEELKEHWLDILGELYNLWKPFMDKGVGFCGNYIYFDNGIRLYGNEKIKSHFGIE
jgi:hypothetical protein